MFLYPFSTVVMNMEEYNFMAHEVRYLDPAFRPVRFLGINFTLSANCITIS